MWSCSQSTGSVNVVVVVVVAAAPTRKNSIQETMPATGNHDYRSRYLGSLNFPLRKVYSHISSGFDHLRVSPTSGQVLLAGRRTRAPQRTEPNEPLQPNPVKSAVVAVTASVPYHHRHWLLNQESPQIIQGCFIQSLLRWILPYVREMRLLEALVQALYRRRLRR